MLCGDEQQAFSVFLEYGNIRRLALEGLLAFAFFIKTDDMVCIE